MAKTSPGTLPGVRSLLLGLLIGGWATIAPVVRAAEPSGRLYEGFGSQDRPRILRPTIGLPTVVRPGDRLTLWFAADRLAASEACKATLRRGDYTIKLTLRPSSSGGASGPGRPFLATIPKTVACPLLYDLNVELGSHRLVEHNAVMVVPEFRADTTLVQITDLEINDRDPGPADRLVRAIREINLIAPDVVLATGDLTYDGRPRQFDQLVAGLRHLEVPVFTVIGNADHHGDEAAYFRTLTAFRDYSADVGRLHLTTFDSGTNYKARPGPYNIATDNEGTGLTDAQIAWMEQDLGRAAGDSLRIVAMHFPAVSQFGNRASIHFNRDRFKSLCERYHVALVFGGHTHVNSIFDRNEKLYVSGPLPTQRPLYVQTATTTSRERAPIFPYVYRLVRIGSQGAIDLTYDANGDGSPDPMSCIPLERLDVQYDPPNDGKAERVTATITNGLNVPLPAARLVVHVAARANARLGVQGGRVLAEVPDGTSRRAVVTTDLAARSKQTVSVFWTSSGREGS